MAKIRKIKVLSILILLAIVVVSCFKQPEYSDVPEIAFKSYEYDGNQYTVGSDGFLNITFTDGDGDLGKVNNDDSSVTNTKNLIIEKVYQYRALISDTFNLPNIPYNGTTEDISGEIKIKLTSIFDPSEKTLTGLNLVDGKDTITMNVKIKDRAGNYSNIITTPKLPRYFP